MKICRSITASVAALLAIISISSVAQAITRRHDRLDSSYLTLGNDYSSEGQLFIGKLDNSPDTCSGTLIEPSWVLTAAHCTNGMISATFNIGQLQRSVINYTPYPEWLQSSRNQLAAGVDIALLQLNAPVTNFNPALLNNGLNEVGKVGTYVGFGDTGTGLTGATTYDGLKRGAKNVVDANGSSFFPSIPLASNLLVADFDDPSGSSSGLGASTSLELEGSTANGDSGGALFIDGVLVGLNNYTFPDYLYSGYGTFIVTTRTLPFNQWISNTISGQSIVYSSFSQQATSTTGNFNQGFTFSKKILAEVEPNAVPEPSALVDLLSAVGLLGLARRRKRAFDSNSGKKSSCAYPT